MVDKQAIAIIFNRMVEHNPTRLDLVFRALSDQTRRAMLERLAKGDHGVGGVASLLFPLVCRAQSSPANAEFEAGKRAFDQGDFASALKQLTPLAQKGDAGAQGPLAQSVREALAPVGQASACGGSASRGPSAAG